jgi:two-component system heavy metal sensor histidine kinase CusS
MSSEKTPDSSAKRSWSLVTRLTVWYSLSAFALIIASTAFLYWALTTNLDREDDQFLSDKIDLFEAILRERPGDSAELEREIAQESMEHQQSRLYVRIATPDGRLLRETQGMSEELSPATLSAVTSIATEPGRSVEVESPNGRSFRVLSSLRLGAGGPQYLIQVAMDRTYEEKLLAGYRRYLWLGLGFALALSTFVGYQIARRGLRPIAEITQTALRVRATTLHERIATGGLPTELFELATQFNEMLDRLKSAFDRIAQFSADIAHELRTPVNNLRGEVEVALGKARSPDEYREVLSSSLEECSRLTRLIDSLLFLSRAENPEVQIHKEKLDVGEQLIAIKDFYEAAAVEAGVSLTLNAEDGLFAQLDRALFQRAVGNLLDNALAHTRSGGTVKVEAIGSGHMICVTISDTGCGIAKEHLPRVFDRFFRVDRARCSDSGNSGLGLAIVKSIATLHRGSVTIESEVGKGTSIRLAFPR